MFVTDSPTDRDLINYDCVIRDNYPDTGAGTRCKPCARNGPSTGSLGWAERIDLTFAQLILDKLNG